jgi:hypothetical protein
VQVDGEDIAEDDLDRRPIGKRDAQVFDQIAVDLDQEQPPALRGEERRERAAPGADLERDTLRVQLGESDDAAMAGATGSAAPPGLDDHHGRFHPRARRDRRRRRR